MQFIHNKLIISTLLLALLTMAGCNSVPAKTPIESDSSTENHLPPQPYPIEYITEKPAMPAWAETVTELQTTPLPEKISLPPDLWERIRVSYQMQVPDNPRISQEIQWYASHPAYIDRIQQRALPYLHFIVEEVEKRGMPMEMALLPVVESAFQPFAYSPGRAAGIWQFIPSTGKIYGLKQNWWYDGRRDVVASTRAALDYLKKMAERFDGDWELALAAYNAGGGSVSKAIRRNRKKNKPIDFWSLKLPKETEGYVPRLLAIASIIGKPIDYGITLPTIANSPYFHSIDIESQLDLALSADMADISIEELYRLNPGFNRWATAPQGPHRLNIPVDKVDGFTDKLAALDPKKRLQWKRYKIRNGDNLSAIARKHNTTIALLQQVNKLRDDRIRAGKHLLIAVASKQLNQYSLSADQRMAKNLNSKRSGKKRIYTVKRGDTLWDIARSYKVSHKALARWNGLSPKDTLKLGRELAIWTKTKSNEKVANSAPLQPFATSPINTLSSLHYRVRKGDSLACIAQKFNVTVASLRKWNTLPSKYLQPGQRLKLYVDVTELVL